MKRSLLFVFLFILTGKSFSQSLAGEWKGTFTACFPNSINVNDQFQNNIKLEFTLNADSTYNIYSYEGDPFVFSHETDHKCELSSTMLDANNIFLEEKRVVESEKEVACFKKFTLQIIKRKKMILLKGSWETSSGSCNDHGEISLSKKL